MNRYIIVVLFWAFALLQATAQEYRISGKVTDAKTGQAMEMVGVKLMKSDSSYVDGLTTGQGGSFSVKAKTAGKYILQFSFIGYSTKTQNITLTSQKPATDIGVIQLATNDRLLAQTTVKARANQVEVKEDTLVYNASAYRTPDGSTLEALVEKLPGAEVSDDGTIKLNGKEVKQILIDGKDFFKGDKSVAMKNLPVDMVEKLKSYEKQSDYTKQTGIDDGNEETVLDVNLKQKLKSSWISNIDLAVGNKHRYSTNIFMTRFTDNTGITAYGRLNNVGDRRFRGGGPGFRGGGGGGLTDTKSGGLDGFWNNGLKEDSAYFFQIGGNFRISHTNTDALTTSNSETFLSNSASSSFANSYSHNFNKNTNFNVGMNLQWNPDSATYIRFRPTFSHSKGASHGDSRSATFNADPYAVENVVNPLDSMFAASDPAQVNAELQAIAVNRNGRGSLSDSKSSNLQGELNITRRLSTKGRSLSFRGEAGYSDNKNHSFSISDIYYYQRTSNNQTYNNQYNNNPSKSWNYNGRLSYSEPLWKNWFFQGSYGYNYKYSDRDRSLYQLDSLRDYGIGNLYPIGTLPDGDSLNLVKNIENSQYATYKDYIHSVNLGIRYATKALNFHVGVRLQPEHTRLEYQKNWLDTTVTRNVFNIAPDLRLRYRMNQFTNLDFRYRGSSSQPSMTDLLDVTDSSDPLNITKGNPGLKPSWSNDFRLFFHTYSQPHQQSIFAHVGFNQTSNSISNAVVYDETTGVRTTRPENINGNWNTNGFVGFNRSLGANNQINLNTGTSASYAHSVGYMSVGGASSQKNTMKTLNLGERLRASYRWELFEFGLNGSINYSNSRSALQKQANLETYTFAYGANLQYTTPWNTGIATDIGMNSRRGYSDNSMNTNELIWNAQISQTFLDKKATLSIQFYDILHQQSNISRVINAQMRRDSRNNAINSYLMVHFIYRLNIFGGQNGRIDTNRDRGFRGGGEGYSPMRMGGGGPGGGRRM